CTHPEDQCPDPAGKCGYVSAPVLGIHKCKYLYIKEKGSLGKRGGAFCLMWDEIKKLNRFKGCALWPETESEILPHCQGVCGSA
ncbi:hypothetical protein ACFLZM_08155, partial [Thermodesulfobacteriota bacterium]